MAQWGIVCSRHRRSLEGDRVGDVWGAERPGRSSGHRAGMMEMSRYSRGQARCRAGVDTTLARVRWWSGSAHCVQGGRFTIRVQLQLANPSTRQAPDKCECTRAMSGSMLGGTRRRHAGHETKFCSVCSRRGVISAGKSGQGLARRATMASQW